MQNADQFSYAVPRREARAMAGEIHAYEIEGYRSDGSRSGSVVLGDMTQAEAEVIVQSYADLWGGKASLFRVPLLRVGDHVPWPEDQTCQVGGFEGRPR